MMRLVRVWRINGSVRVIARNALEAIELGEEAMRDHLELEPEAPWELESLVLEPERVWMHEPLIDAARRASSAVPRSIFDHERTAELVSEERARKR